MQKAIGLSPRPDFGTAATAVISHAGRWEHHFSLPPDRKGRVCHRHGFPGAFPEFTAERDKT
ncbi:hypothetical protein ACWEGE_38335 [Amycolatopsis sp. NPDC004747]